MTKDQQIEAIAKTAGITAKQARLALDAVPAVVIAALLHDDHITIHGLGRFEMAHRQARRVTNPATGEPMELPAKMVVKFRPAKQLRERVQ